MNSNEITTIEGLDGLVDLKTLSLDSNYITHISGLGDHLEIINTLMLSNNKISVIEGLDGLKNLTSLKLTKLKIFA